MSSEEPVSAYSVFKAAKNMAGGNSNKNSKKKQKGAKTSKEQKKKKSQMSYATPAGSEVAKIEKGKNNNVSNVSKTASAKKKSKKKATKDLKKASSEDSSRKKSGEIEFKGSEVIALVDKLYTDDDKKLSKNDQKKKKELEDYLVKQLEMDDSIYDDEYDSFDSASFSDEESEEQSFNSDSSAFSVESNTNKSDSYSEEEHNLKALSYGEEQTSNEESNEMALQSKVNKKRKSVTESTQTKKLKNNEDADKPAPRKSMSVSNSEKSQASSKKASSSKTLNKITDVNLGDVAKMDSIVEGKRAFMWLLNPVTIEDFFSKYWEKKACLIQRHQSSYFKHLISFEKIDQMLLKNHVEFTKNIDVTTYENGVRETLNPEGRALPPVVWDHYGQGCSIRLLNPQTFLPDLFELSTTLQEYFHCLVGANAYLTPPNSQGFAPHYDDIEAFVLQIEGRKRWKLYKPRSKAELLPRYSSKNFKQEEIGEPILEKVLEPGDVLYFPRGTIHQACTEPGYHSLHITLSVYQKQSFADLFEKMLPLMLQKAIAANVDLRRGLPLNAWHNTGIAFSQDTTKERHEFTKVVSQLMQKCIWEMPLESIIDAAMDQLAKKFQHEALPPEILPAEKLRTVFGSRSRVNERGECVCDYDIDERTNVRLLRANILRLVEEEGKMRIYYYVDNSKEYCEYEPNFIEIDASEAASVEVLIKSYPQYVGVSQLPLPSDEKKINLATALWEMGLLMMEKPF